MVRVETRDAEVVSVVLDAWLGRSLRLRGLSGDELLVDLVCNSLLK